MYTSHGFFKGVGRGVIGAIAQPIGGGLDFASSAFEGIDATKDQLIGRPRAGTTNRRLRLLRAIGGDGKVTAFLGSDATEKVARVEEVKQALLRRTQDAGGDHVVILTNQCIMKLRAPGFAQVHKAAASGMFPTSLMEIPPAEDMLTVELRWGNRDGPYPDRLTVHRKSKPGQQEEEPLALPELRYWPNLPQADQIRIIALKVQRKYYSEPSKDSQQWASRHDQLAHAMPSASLANMDLLAGDCYLILSVCLDLMRRRNTQQCISFWQPVAPPGYLPLGHVPSIGLDPPADPVLVYRNDSEKGSSPSVKPAQEFHLIWRQNGRSPVTMRELLPPQGYRALGTVVVPDAEQPGSK
ncbi:TPA: hypothetical protein ACH3X2_001206 [Trebouxia sp. C0005]